MRGKKCENCKNKKDYMKYLLSIQSEDEEFEMEYQDPNTPDKIFEDQEQDIALIRTDPIFLNREDRQKRFRLIARLQSLNFDTTSLTTVPTTTKKLKQRREKFLDEKEKEGLDEQTLKRLKDQWDVDEYDDDEL